MAFQSAAASRAQSASERRTPASLDEHDLGILRYVEHRSREISATPMADIRVHSGAPDWKIPYSMNKLLLGGLIEKICPNGSTEEAYVITGIGKIMLRNNPAWLHRR